MREYFKALYGSSAGKPWKVGLYRKGGTGGSWFIDPVDVDSLSRCTAAFGLSGDVYCMVNALDADAVADICERGGRGAESEVAAVTALVADIDATKPGAARNYPPQDKIVEALRGIPLRPSIINLSGREDGGFHVYWLLEEPIDVTHSEVFARVKSCSKRWQAVLRSLLEPFELDSTYDLARVLRPAGSYNHKHGCTVRPVVFRPERRYRIDDFEQHLPPLPPPVGTRRFYPIGGGNVGAKDAIDRARRYVTKIPGAVSGQGGHNQTFHVACVLVHGFALSTSDALAVLSEWNEVCDPPWSGAELWHKIESAADTPSDRGQGYLLQDDSGTDSGGDSGANGQPAPQLDEHGFTFSRLPDGQWRYGPPRTETPAKPLCETDAITLEEYRERLSQARLDSLGTETVNLDRSPPGAGKSTADIPAMRLAGTSLIVLPTHRNCEEAEADFERAELVAAAYPPLNAETCRNYIEAEKVIGFGLSPSACLCLCCSFKADCDYQDAMRAAELAAHRIATHRRAELSFETIADGRRYVSIHENPIGLLRPTVAVPGNLDAIAAVARKAKDDAKDRGDATSQHFFTLLEDAACWLTAEIQTALDTVSLVMPPSANKPLHAESNLLRAIRGIDARPSGDAMRVCMAAASGDLAELCVRVDQVFAPGRALETHKSILAVWQTKLPERATIWINDATSTAEDIAAIAGRPVIDQTPGGSLQELHRIVQVANDVKLSSSPRTALKVLRGVLAAFPEAKRVGVITHRRHCGAISGTSKVNVNLDATTRRRIAKVEHYRGARSRGSNSFLGECDLIVCLGTPRVPPEAVRTYLIQTGRAPAAARSPEFSKVKWDGTTETGHPVTVEGLGYASDLDWQAAHRAIVASELRQAYGRGRAVCEHGIDVVVVSNERLGLPILDQEISPLPDSHSEILDAIFRLLAGREGDDSDEGGESQRVVGNSTDNANGGISYNISIVENTTVSTPAATVAEISRAVQKTGGRIREVLRDLLTRGLVEKIGQRGGWRLTKLGVELATPLDGQDDIASGGQEAIVSEAAEGRVDDGRRSDGVGDEF